MFGLLVGILTYFVSSLGGIAIVKFLNYFLCFRSWLLFALLSRSTWLLSCPLHGGLQRWEDVSLRVTTRQLRLYFVIAFGLSMVELCNAFSMSILPGSWYALLKGSDVGFSMALSRWILGRRYKSGQMLGAGFVMAGIGMVFLLGSPSHVKENRGEVMTEDSSISLTVAAAFCVCGACLNAACAVLTEAALKQTLKEEEQRMITCGENAAAPSKLLLSNAYSMWTTLFAFALLSLPAILSGQLQGAFQSSSNELGEACKLGDDDSSSRLTCMLLLLGVMRFGERLSKHWICVSDSAVTFSLVQAARRLSGVFILAAVCREAFPQSMIAGSLSSAIGLAMHVWYGRPAAADEEEASSTHKSARHEYELVTTVPIPRELPVDDPDTMHQQ